MVRNKEGGHPSTGESMTWINHLTSHASGYKTMKSIDVDVDVLQ